MSERNKAVLAQANAAVAGGDHEGFLAYCTDDTEWRFVGERTLRGKEAVRAFMREAYAEPPVFSVDRMIAEGDHVTAVGEIRVKDDDGNWVRSAYCDVWRLRDGKLASLSAYVVRIGGEE